MTQRTVRCLVLSALAAESRHGAGIITEVGVISGGQVRLRAGSLFTALSDLRAARLITVERDEIVDHRLRRYYRLTLAGQQRLAARVTPSRAPVLSNPQNRKTIPMSATLQLSRPFRLADAVWPYRVLLDGQPAGEITAGERSSLEVTPGSHALQIRSLHVVNRRLGFASPTVTFDVSDGESADFVCLVRPFVLAVFWWFVCLVGDQSRWIVLERGGSERRAGAK